MSSEPFGFRTICPTRCSVFQEPWDECFETNLEREIRGHITGVKYQKILFCYFFDVRLGYLLVNHSDNLSDAATLTHAVGECQNG